MEKQIRKKNLTEQDIEDGKKLNDIFQTLSERGKIMATTYLSALRDKEIMESTG